MATPNRSKLPSLWERKVIVTEKQKRIEILDALRGLALIVMIIYHTAYDIWSFEFFKGSRGVTVVSDFILSGNLWLVQLIFQCVFISIAGISCNFSRSNFKRGLRILAFAYVISIVTYFMGAEIWFGILHFMGFSILIYALFERLKIKISAVPMLVWFLLFVLAYNIPNILWYVKHIDITPIEPIYFNIFGLKAELPLYIIGLNSTSFNTVDYFPLIPYIFIFFAGVSFGKIIKEHRLPDWFYNAKVPFLPKMGQHSLTIYVLHQPIIFGVLWGLNWI